MAEQVRRELLVRTAVDILAGARGPVPAKQMMQLIAERVDLTEFERSVYASGAARYAVVVQWASTWMDHAGWLTKSKEGWTLTDAGRAARERLSPADFLRNATKAYRAAYTAKKASSGWTDPRWETVREAIEAVPEGSWTAYKDLADLVGIPAQTVGSFIADIADVDNGYRVLSVDGTVAPEFRWADPGRTDDPRDLLQAEGVRFDPSGRASQDQRMGADDLRQIIGVPAAGARAWLVRGSAVSGVNVTPQWLADGFVSLAASHLRPVEAGIDLDELRAAVEADYAHLSYQLRKAKLAELHAFLNRMRAGDAVVTTSEGQVYAGRIDGDPTFSAGGGDTLTTVRRPVVWRAEAVDFGDLSDVVSGRLRSSAVVLDLTDIADAIEALVADAPVVIEPGPAPVATLPDPSPGLLDRLFVARAWVEEFVELLRLRRQVILYGPPGTGKTYLAIEVAEALTDRANVRFVQFHPSYSYEDFFEGYRPTQSRDGGPVGFTLASGPLREIAEDAQANPGVPYVLVIDEINRANLAKVFGELYFLLEYRNRGIRLMYAADRNAPEFTLPANLYVVGTMNTADRSIALVDAAMRRRFAFLSLHPDDAHLRGVLRCWLTAHDLPAEPADLLDALNERIPDRDFKVGPAYLMKKDEVGADGGLERLWRTSIMPLLEEFHHGDDVDVQRRYGLPALRTRIARAAVASTTTTPAGLAGPAEPAGPTNPAEAG